MEECDFYSEKTLEVLVERSPQISVCRVVDDPDCKAFLFHPEKKPAQLTKAFLFYRKRKTHFFVASKNFGVFAPRAESGSFVFGAVLAVANKSVFLSVPGLDEGRVLFSNLSDAFVLRPEEVFLVGKVLRARVLVTTPLELTLNFRTRTNNNNKFSLMGKTVEGVARPLRMTKAGIFVEVVGIDGNVLLHKKDFVDSLGDATETYALLQKGWYENWPAPVVVTKRKEGLRGSIDKKWVDEFVLDSK